MGPPFVYPEGYSHGMAERKKRPEMQRTPEKIGKRYQFTKEDLEKALKVRRETGAMGGARDHQKIVSRRDAAEVADVIDQHGRELAEQVIPNIEDTHHLYPKMIAALEDGLESDNWRERFECTKLLLAYFWGRPTQQIVTDKQVQVMFNSPALKHMQQQPNGGS